MATNPNPGATLAAGGDVDSNFSSSPVGSSASCAPASAAVTAGTAAGGAAAAPARFTSEELLAQKRQEKLLESDEGFNISPIGWDKYGSIGRNGTFATDAQAIESVIGSIKPGNSTITKAQARQLEQALGLDPLSLDGGFKIRKIQGLSSPRSPMSGNSSFRGPGKHLPGGGPELVVDSVPTKDCPGVVTIGEVSVI